MNRRRLAISGRSMLLAAGCLATGMLLAAVSAPADPMRGLDDSADRDARAGRITQAVQEYNRSMAVDPARSRPYIGLVILYEGLGRADLAIDALEQLREVNPGAAHLWCRLAEAHLGVEDTRGARELGQEAVRREPDCPRALSAYGMALARSRYWDSAAAVLSRAWDLAPDDGGIGETLIEVQIQQGDAAGALATGARLLAAGDNSANLHYQLAWVYGRVMVGRGAEDRAIAHLNEATRLSPRWFEPWAELGRIYGDRGETHQAVAAFQQAWSLDPTVPGVAYNLQALWQKTGRPERARAVRLRFNRLIGHAEVDTTLRAAYKSSPGNVENTVRLAREEERSGNYGPALYRLRRLLGADPADVEVLQLYAQIDARARRGYPDYLRPGPGVTTASL